MGFVLSLSFVQPSLALTPEQKRLYQSNVLYFDIEESARTCGSSTTLTGSEGGEQIYGFFLQKGLTPEQAAGVTGNAQLESGFDPLAHNPSGPEYLGIFQWDKPGRWLLLKTYAASKGQDPNTLVAQLDFAWYEATERGDIAGLKAQGTTLELATWYWGRFYEVAIIGGSKSTTPMTNVQELDKRVQYAKDALAKYGSSSPGASSGSTVCGSSSGQVTGGYSLPVDKKWYDQHKDWFTKTHQRYPAADIPVPTGTSVFSMTDGTVVAVSPNGDCGKGVIVDRADGVRFTYCHGSDGGSVAGAKAGDKVVAGQKIMSSASTGDSSGPHLHLEIEIKGTNHCPQNLFVGIVEGNPPDPKSLPTSGCTY